MYRLQLGNASDGLKRSVSVEQKLKIEANAVVSEYTIEFYVTIF